MDKDMVVFGRKGCPYTEDARKLLNENNISYIYVEVPKVPHSNMEPIFDIIASEKDHKTVPCIFSLKYIGGYTDLLEKFNEKNDS